jgi:hypothetical protein
MMRSVLALGALISCLAGCATNPTSTLPAYHWVDTETALRDLRTRASSVTTLASECSITLKRSDGETVQFDGAMAMRNPGFLRLRAWKFNRAVFDLTLQPDGLWLMTLDDPARKEQVVPVTVRAADFMEQWSWFNGGMFESESLRASVNGDTLILTSVWKSGEVRCEVERSTLTPHRYVYEAAGQTFELTMDRYTQTNGVPWPLRLVANSATGEVIIEQRNVEINGPLPPNAFVPPGRAEKRQ